MRYLILGCFLLLFSHTLQAQNKTRTHTEKVDGKDVQTKKYFFVILVKGQTFGKSNDAKSLKLLENSHRTYINKLSKEGKVLLSGPFSDDEFKRGILVFDCDTEEEVMRLLKTDPMMTAGWLGYEIHPWWVEKNCLFK